MRVLTFFLLSTVFKFSTAQTVELEIKYIDFKDSRLKTEITNYIISEKNRDTLFAKRGYIILTPTQPHQNHGIKSSFYLNKGYSNFDNLSDNNIFPAYYTFLQGKPVLLFGSHRFLSDFLTVEYSLHTKIKFQKTIEPFLAKPVPSSKSPFNSKMPFRPDELIRLHGGMIVTVYENGYILIEEKGE